MNPQNPQQSAVPQGPVNNPLSVMQENEVVICEINRHPIGIFGIYIMSGLIIIVVAVIGLIVAPNVVNAASKSQVTGIGALVFIVVAVIAGLFAFVSGKIYWGNRWIVTSDSVTQISRTGLFDKQSGQLSLGNLEDVTAEQNGILTHMFNYGLLRLETAGERSKFTFPFCPNPNKYAQQILQAREAFEQGRRGEQNMQRPYRSQEAYAQPPAGQQPQ